MASTGLHAAQRFGVCGDTLCFILLMSNLNIETGLRSNIIKHHYQDKASLKERTYASALCGGIAGGSVTKLMGTVSRTERTSCGITSNQIK